MFDTNCSSHRARGDVAQSQRFDNCALEIVGMGPDERYRRHAIIAGSVHAFDALLAEHLP